LLISDKGNSSAIDQGTFAHPDLAPQIAMWANKKFAIQVSRWIQKLLITGSVELGKENSGPELKQKLEETFQAVDEDEKSFLREKRCLKLSLLRIECDKRQRDDAAANEERAAKRQRDDYDNAKRQRDDAVAEEERAAKRRRDDAAADDKAKEESRMQLVRFDAEMADKAIATASLKKKEELDYNNLLMPFVENIENRTNDAHVKALCKDIGMALLNQAKFLITGESSASQETRFCDDVTTIGRKLGFNKIFVEKHRVSLGRAVAAEFRLRNPLKEPQSTEKHVNSSYRSVFTYDVKDNEWIEDVVRQCLTKNMPAPVVPPSPKAPSRTIINYFTQ
jgi:hypothetical protein